MFSAVNPMIVPLFAFAPSQAVSDDRMWASELGSALARNFRLFTEDRKSSVQEQKLETLGIERSPTISSSEKLLKLTQIPADDSSDRKRVTEEATIKDTEREQSPQKISSASLLRRKPIRKTSRLCKSEKGSSCKIEKQVNPEKKLVEVQKQEELEDFQAVIPPMVGINHQEIQRKIENLLSRAVSTWPDSLETRRFRAVKQHFN